MTRYDVPTQGRIVKALLVAMKSSSPSKGLELFAESSKHPDDRAVLLSIATSLARGEKLSAAIERAKCLPDYLLAAVAAGEAAEDLCGALASIHRAVRRHEDVSRLLESVLSYPRTVLGIFFLVVPFVLHIMIRFSKNVTEFSIGAHINQPITFLAKLPTSVGLGAFLLGALIAWQFLSRQSTLMRFVESNYFKIPLLSGVYHLHTLSIFCSTMSLLIAHGLPFDEALRAAAAGAPPRMADVIGTAAESARIGTPPADCFNGGGEIPPTFSWYLRTSSDEGLAETFENLADYYEQDMQGWRDYLAPIIEVSLIVFMGFLVGGTVIPAFQSIIKLVNVAG